MLNPDAARAYLNGLDKQQAERKSRAPDRYALNEQEAADYIYSDLDQPSSDAPLLVDERTSCTSHVYAASGKKAPTLWDCGSTVNLVDATELDKLVPGDDFDELDVVPPDLVGLGAKQVSTARAVLLHVRCYVGGPLVSIPAVVAELRNFGVSLFIGRQGLRQLRAKIDFSAERDVVVLDCGDGGCEHHIKAAQGSSSPTVAIRIKNRLGPPPGLPYSGPVVKLQRAVEPAMVAVLAAAVRMVAAVAVGGTEYNSYDADRQLKEKALAEKAAATLSDLATPTQHPTWEDCVAKAAHLPEQVQRELGAKLLFKWRHRFYMGGALPAMRGYAFDVAVKEDSKGFLHKPIPLRPQHLGLAHDLVRSWIQAGHASYLTQAERALTFRAPCVFQGGEEKAAHVC